ncbi:MAG: valine--tRNA ligase [Planctomycetaceae bacterium]|nr:valine--tRNA ligase [Planctomycetaceae bacterium]
MREIPSIYDPVTVEKEALNLWEQGRFFHADETIDNPKGTYAIVIPPPNVTAALHLGHALNNTLQDILIRWRRMQGYSTLWMPGTDHAGIATQTVVEKRLLAEQGKRRTDFAREEFVAHVQSWKDEYEARILQQLKSMGCSCDWPRTRFTMDETCAKAVRTVFFNLFKDGLIYRGKRLVNWDPATQTVLADDEVEHQTVQGFFWYLRYPLVEPVECNTGILPVNSGNTSILPVEDAIRMRQGAHLPHWTKEDAVYAVSFRLADSLPARILEAWQIERQSILQRAKDQKRELTEFERQELERLYDERIESYLDAGHGECVLRDPRAAGILADALNYFDGQRYHLVAWAIMPNHVHVILKPIQGDKLSEILHSWKSYTANEINKALGREGGLWMVEYYDHLIRNEADLQNQVAYVLGNPGKAGLQDWQWVGQCGLDKMHGQDARDTDTGILPVILTHVTVATTRPETMLGDTAVAMNPADPRAKYLVGKMVRLPIVGRLIPIIADDHVVLPDPNSADEKAKFSTGFLKVTPAHDPDDYAIGQRHDLPIINVMAPDGSISEKFGWTDWDAIKNPDVENVIGMDRFEARESIVEWFRQEKLLEDVRDYAHEVGHSYRSHVPIEPYLSDQWYIAVKKPIDHLSQKFGTGLIEGTDVPVNSLAGLALKPLLDKRLKFIPDRYTKNYQTWLENLRDWPISRQLWWGHQIPVWSTDMKRPTQGDLTPVDGELSEEIADKLKKTIEDYEHTGVISFKNHAHFQLPHPDKQDWIRIYKCVDSDNKEFEEKLEKDGWVRDGDVLDTWFSSALWPFSTMGWPDESETLKKFYPTDVLCTAREIITLWVSRMVMMGQYCMGDIPFSDVYIHAMIQDGLGRKMSKSLGNGIDPLVAIDSHGADAMRFTLASMTTDTQDVRMPVAELTLPDGRVVNSSPKFDIGRNFCNKLWNASRFAMMNLEGADPEAFDPAQMTLTDKWILSRLAQTIAAVTSGLEAFKYNEPLNELYRFFWNDFCDWYLEWAKPRMQDPAQKPVAQNVLAFVLDQALRLLHPFVPFITEGIFQNLNAIMPRRGLKGIVPLETAQSIMIAPWPQADQAWICLKSERQIERIQNVVRAIRDVRSRYNIVPSRPLVCSAAAPGEAASHLNANAALISQLTNLSSFAAAENSGKPEKAAAVVVEEVQLYVHDVIDPEAERQRLLKQKDFIEKGIKPLWAKLNNENFISRAAPEVVEQSRRKLRELTDQLAAVENLLAELK